MQRIYKGKTYSEWLQSLQIGDMVRVRHPWDDSGAKGGVLVDGVVSDIELHPVLKITISSIYKDKDDTTIFSIKGYGNFRRLEHPEVLSIVVADTANGTSLEFSLPNEWGTDVIHENTRIGGSLLRAGARQSTSQAVWM